MSVGTDFPLLMIRAEIASGKATVRSLGTLYMVAMANAFAKETPRDWNPINTAIGDHLGGDTLADRMRKLDKVKQVAWTLYEGVCAIQADQREGRL